MKKKVFLTALFAFVLLIAAACGGINGQSASSQEEFSQSSEQPFSSVDAEESSSFSEEMDESSIFQSSERESGEQSSVVEQSSENIENSEGMESSEKVESSEEVESSEKVESSEEVESSEGVESSPEIPEGYFLVTFDSDGGTAVESVSVKEGGKVCKPQDPQKSSDKYTYEFVGWYYGDVAWDFEKNVVTENITLVAKWKKDSTNILFPPKN